MGLNPGADVKARTSTDRRWLNLGNRTKLLRENALEISKCTFKRVNGDNIVDLAAQVAFYFVLSLVPFLIVLAAIVGWLPSSNLWQSFAQWITDYFPNRSRQAVFSTILDLTRGYTGFLSFGLLAAVWSASSGFMSLMEALSVACCGKDKRGYWRKRAIATAATLVASIFFILSFGLWTMGHWATTRFLPSSNILVSLNCGGTWWPGRWEHYR